MAKLAELAGCPLLAGAVISGAVLTAALIHAPLASADPAFNSDEQKFLGDVQAAGLVDEAGSQKAVQSGWQICSDISNGTSPEHEAITIAQGSASRGPSKPGDTDLTLSDAQQLVSIAMTDLCPPGA